MQLLAEAADVLRRGAGLDDDQLADAFSQLNAGPLQSFLVEITAALLRQDDDLPPVGASPDAKPAPGKLVDRYRTRPSRHGKWTSQDAPTSACRSPPSTWPWRRATSRRSGRRGSWWPSSSPTRSSRRSRAGGAGGGRAGSGVSRHLHRGPRHARRGPREYAGRPRRRTWRDIWRGGWIDRAATLETFRAAFDADATSRRRRRARDRPDAGRRARPSAPWWPPPPAPASPRVLAPRRLPRRHAQRRLPANIVQAQRDFSAPDHQCSTARPVPHQRDETVR